MFIDKKISKTSLYEQFFKTFYAISNSLISIYHKNFIAVLKNIHLFTIIFINRSRKDNDELLAEAVKEGMPPLSKPITRRAIA